MTGEPGVNDAREIFEGSDRVWGSEICEGLRSEGLGVPVIYENSKDKTVQIRDLRNPGEKDEKFHRLETNSQELLGVILPVDVDKNEFVYVSAGREQGIVFQDSSNNSLNFSGTVPYVLQEANRSLVDLIKNFSRYFKDTTRLILQEDTDPSRYAEIVEAAVQSARQRQHEIMEKRGELRKGLFGKLFGSR